MTITPLLLFLFKCEIDREGGPTLMGDHFPDSADFSQLQIGFQWALFHGCVHGAGLNKPDLLHQCNISIRQRKSPLSGKWSPVSIGPPSLP